MFEFILKKYIRLLSFSASSATKCVSLNKEPYMIEILLSCNAANDWSTKKNMFRVKQKT